MPFLLDVPPPQRDATPAECRFAEYGWGTEPAVRFVPEYVEDERTTPETHWRTADWISKSSLAGFMETVRQVGHVASGDESDDYGLLRPTHFALLRTMEVLSRALKASLEDAGRRQTSCVFPRGSVTTDDNGGIRIEWFDADKAVHLVVPSKRDGQEYLYYECGDDYGRTDRVNGSVLARRLQRLFG